MRFKSRKNQVTLEEGVIIKRFKDPNALAREAEALQRLHRAGLAVPRLLAKNENFLRLEYIPGKTYADLAETMDKEKAVALGRWLAEYHRITGKLRGDVNLRNFLWTGTDCAGVDFEEPPLEGEQESDQGRILAFAVTYEPAFSQAKTKSAQLLTAVFSELGADWGKMRQAYLAEITAMNRRRKGFFVSLEEAALFLDQLAE